MERTLSRFNNCNGEDHWNAAKRVLKDLKVTAKYRLTYQNSDLEFMDYVDEDFANDESDRKS